MRINKLIVLLISLCPGITFGLDMAFPDLSPGIGFDAGIGATHRDEGGWGTSAEVHFTLFIVNGSLEYSKYDDDESSGTSAYFGIGFGSAIQLQRGFGNDESMRIRSMINLDNLIHRNISSRTIAEDLFMLQPLNKRPLLTAILSPYLELEDGKYEPSKWRFGVNLGLSF